MSLKIIKQLKDEIEPVIIGDSIKLLQAKIVIAKNFTGELSSVTGIQSKGLYIAKINPFTCNPEKPTVNIITDTYIHLK